MLWAWLVPGYCCCCFTVVAAATEPEPSHRRPTGLLWCRRRPASLSSSLSVSQLSREGFQGSGYRCTCCCIASSRRHRITPLTCARTRTAGTGLGFRVLGFLGLRVGDRRRRRQRRGKSQGIERSGSRERNPPFVLLLFFIFLFPLFCYNSHLNLK